MSKLEDDLKIPYVSQELIDYLNSVFNPYGLLDKPINNSDILVGYLQGCKDIITHLRTLKESGEDD